MKPLCVKSVNGELRVSRHIGGSFWHVVTLTQQYDSAPWNISRQEIYMGADGCIDTPEKITLLTQPGRSQTEYAYRVDGDFVGAYAHGNETLRSPAQLIVDGEPLQFDSSGCARALRFDLTQEVYADVNGPVAETLLVHQFDVNGFCVNHTHRWLRSEDVGFFYSAMLPVNNDGVFNILTVDQTDHLFASYLGAQSWTPPAEVYEMRATGFACDGLLPIKSTIAITPQSVDSYNANGSRDAAWQINRAGQDIWSKAYFERVSTGSPASVTVGDVWQASAKYTTCISQHG